MALKENIIFDPECESVAIEAPIRIRSTANIKEHWRKTYSMRKKNLEILNRYIPDRLPTLPIKITITRVAPRKLDTDNLIYSVKEYRDWIADLIIPGLKPGRADNNSALSFFYQQIHKSPKEYGIIILVESDQRSLK